jgi:dephospho-CoA kinase
MKPAERPLLIGLTGSIASGKSKAAEWFSEQGYLVLSSDRIGHELLQIPEIKERLISRYGSVIIESGKIDRKKLGRIIFSDPDEREYSNDLLHPEILKKVQEQVDSSEEDFIVIEIPLLFEKKLKDCFDVVLNITADMKVRKKRIRDRNSLSDSEIEDRVRSQMPDDQKIAEADLNIFNNGTITELSDELKKITEKLEKIKKKKVKRFLEV